MSVKMGLTEERFGVYYKDGFLAKDSNGVVEWVEKLNLENLELQYHAVWSNECIEF